MSKEKKKEKDEEEKEKDEKENEKEEEEEKDDGFEDEGKKYRRRKVKKITKFFLKKIDIWN